MFWTFAFLYQAQMILLFGFVPYIHYKCIFIILILLIYGLWRSLLWNVVHNDRRRHNAVEQRRTMWMRGENKVRYFYFHSIKAWSTHINHGGGRAPRPLQLTQAAPTDAVQLGREPRLAECFRTFPNSQ